VARKVLDDIVATKLRETPELGGVDIGQQRCRLDLVNENLGGQNPWSGSA
jgi:hypothetical protein